MTHAPKKIIGYVAPNANTKKSPNRLYNNRRWREASARYLSKHPLCVMCEQRGLVTTSTETDHIKPHKGDEQLFWDVTNWQALCKPCHSTKTSTETRSPLKYPKIGKPPCRVVLVCGSVGSGRRSYAKQHMTNHDVCISHDIYTDQQLTNISIAQRNKDIQSLTSLTHTAYIILDAPTCTERRYWRDMLDADHVVVILSNPHEMPTDQRSLAMQWHRNYTADNGEKVLIK